MMRVHLLRKENGRSTLRQKGSSCLPFSLSSSSFFNIVRPQILSQPFLWIRRSPRLQINNTSMICKRNGVDITLGKALIENREFVADHYEASVARLKEKCDLFFLKLADINSRSARRGQGINFVKSVGNVQWRRISFPLMGNAICPLLHHRLACDQTRGF